MQNNTRDFLKSLPSPEQIKEDVGSACFQRGKTYQLQSRVLNYKVDIKNIEIFSVVEGNSGQSYETSIELANIDDQPEFFGECTCPVGDDCKHVVATLLHVIDQMTQNKLIAGEGSLDPSIVDNKELNDWFNHAAYDMNSCDDDEQVKLSDYVLVYLLGYSEHSSSAIPPLKVMLSLCRRLKKGGLGRPKKFSQTSISHQKYLTDEDETLIFKLAYNAEKGFISEDYRSGYELRSSVGSQLLEEIISTGKGFWGEDEAWKPVSLGDKKSLDFRWRESQDGNQKLHHNLDEQIKFIPLNPCWYYDKSANQCGQLQSNIPPKLIPRLLVAPIVRPELADQAIKQFNLLDKSFFQAVDKQKTTFKFPAPKAFGKPDRQDIQQPIPCLRLKSVKVSYFFGYRSRYHSKECDKIAAAELGFYYHQRFISMHEKNEFVYFIEKQKMKFSPRNFIFENKMAKDLGGYDALTQASDGNDFEVLDHPGQHSWLIGLIVDHQQAKSDEAVVKSFLFNIIPTLKLAGWKVEIDATFPCNYVDEESVDWYADIDESSYDWFGFKLGVQVDGENINILPLLVDLLSQNRFCVKNALSDEEKLIVKLPDGRLLPIPAERVQNIINVLTELFDSNVLEKDGSLRLSRMRAAQLLELNAAMGAAKMRWVGGQRLIALGEKLKQFKGIKNIAVPKTFKATLRPYQQEGVNWLQFLREYDLSGILADDMGLGKTVQALAHLMIEKAEKRANLPSLIVMPTSLVTNWQMEAERFAPMLKVLKLHGGDRHQHFESLSQYDLIFTTYPLLTRDKAKLCQQEFYLLILDEAQVIKNPKAQSTQVVHQLKAKHRLCMTGTPMENHLGELWSLMHFLMPGFLGDANQFKRLFRTPIEKNDDEERRLVLAARVKPFILRRQKQDVLKELPEKTEIIQHVEFDSVQRDLYESIRVAMHKKVTQAIQSKGLSRSHIIILDALLKLRQVCCDPRLVKLKAAEKAHNASAKLTMLMDMLPSLVEEGRRILLFSQFTSMIALIEDELIQQNLSYVKLTGQTKNRAEPIMRFQNKEVPIFLISLKAGGTGLNLTAADAVIHYDPWWNPAVEDQATDRAHRIGQDKAVFVYKFIAKGTVEETILEMQKKKRKLISGLFSNQEGSAFKLLNKDLELLFQPL